MLGESVLCPPVSPDMMSPMKNFLKDFKNLDFSWKMILIGTLITFLGVLFGIDPIGWMGAGIAIFGWIYGASK